MKMSGKLQSAARAACLGFALVAGLAAAAPTAEARVYVGIYAPIAPPPPRHEIRPYRPGPAAVWVPGHWRWASHRHIWVNGYWGYPPRHYHAWVPGHWRSTWRGWIWIGGHWR